MNIKIKNIQRIVFFIFSAMLVLGCNKSEPFEGEITALYPPDFSGTSALDLRIKKAYDEYQIHYKPEFDRKEFVWNWHSNVAMASPSEKNGWNYSKADKTVAVEVIDAVENIVLKPFPKDFSVKYMPRNILMVDTMERLIEVTENTYVHRILEGYLTTNALILPYVSKRFEQVKGTRMLAESWLSLFIEKALVSMPKIPNEFYLVSQLAYKQIEISNADDITTKYGILKKSREKQKMESPTSAWGKTTVEQDFSDFVAFIIYTPENVKALAYQKNAKVKEKEQLIKKYFKNNFGIDLPYLPINN